MDEIIHKYFLFLFSLKLAYVIAAFLKQMPKKELEIVMPFVSLTFSLNTCNWINFNNTKFYLKKYTFKNKF